MNRYCYLLALVLTVVGGLGGPVAAEYVWLEAEQPAAGNFPAANPFAPEDAQQADALSGGDWIGATDTYPEPLFLEYDFVVAEGGTYQLYVRKFWQHGPFRWRFEGDIWRQVGRDIGLLDAVELRQFIVANWVGLGLVELAPGTHRLRLEMLEGEGAVAFDALLLTNEPFVPRGRLKPGQRLGRAPEGWFAFETGVDPFAETPLDLRPLNEEYAGQGGFIRPDGDGFVHGSTGEQVRFWGVNAGPDIWQLDNASLRYLARRLAKLGVNAVRLHGPVYDRTGTDLGAVDQAVLERLFYIVHVLAQEGIYSGLSIYFPLWIDMDPKWGYDGYAGEHPFALLFFNPDFQAAYKNWWRAVLTQVNPHSGKSLSQDPAVAWAELVNEDSYFFWTFQPYQSIPAAQMPLLERAFGHWLAEGYGDVATAQETWGGPAIRGDEAVSGRAGFVPVWELFNRKNQRSRDTAQFLALHQRDFFAAMAGFLRDDLGFSASISGSNWITASPQVLGPLDKYSNSGLDFIDRHGYFGPLHEGPRASFSLNEGDTYSDRRALLFEGPEGGEPTFDLPLADLQYAGKPSMISEINWPQPNRFRADMPLLAAAYGALQGTDGLFFFTLTGADWEQTASKFSLQTPVLMGQFPALALAYRYGLVAQGPSVFEAVLGLDSLFALAGTPVPVAQNLDAFRAADIPPGQSLSQSGVAAVDPLAYYVGPVRAQFVASGTATQAVELSPYIDRQARTLASASGQLTWDYGRGVMQVNAPTIQGATGFLRQWGPVALDDITLDIEVEYGAVVLVALDGRPLATSARILMQVASEEANYGWQAPGSGRRTIEDLGGPPLVLRQMAGTVELHRSDAAELEVVALDAAGYGTGRRVGSARIELQPQTLYYLIEEPQGPRSSAIEETGVGKPANYGLEQNYPNPFNGSTDIRFELPTAAAVDVALYNLGGQKVLSLAQGDHAAGVHKVAWDGADAQGKPLASGVYLYRMQAAGWAQTRRLVLLR